MIRQLAERWAGKIGHQGLKGTFLNLAFLAYGDSLVPKGGRFVKDAECVALLRWALPRLGMRWEGFRKVRRQVCKRVDRRLAELGLASADAYRPYLAAHPSEWTRLDAMCRIPISRFSRDRAVFERLASEVLPILADACTARGASTLRAWSAGCASGEEPYSLKLLWQLEVRARYPAIALEIVATDAEPHMLERARRARYGASSLRTLPAGWIERAFRPVDGQHQLRPEFTTGIELRCEDIRECCPVGPFDLVLCRNLAFTYFDDELQRDTLTRLADRLVAGGFLVIGSHESLPPSQHELTIWDARMGLYRRT
jgi:chemotaxis protein methyltransferase CheR